jgi:hypothetical protein
MDNILRGFFNLKRFNVGVGRFNAKDVANNGFAAGAVMEPPSRYPAGGTVIGRFFGPREGR